MRSRVLEKSKPGLSQHVICRQTALLLPNVGLAPLRLWRVRSSLIFCPLWLTPRVKVYICLWRNVCSKHDRGSARELQRPIWTCAQQVFICLPFNLRHLWLQMLLRGSHQEEHHLPGNQPLKGRGRWLRRSLITGSLWEVSLNDLEELWVDSWLPFFNNKHRKKNWREIKGFS